MDLSQYPTPRLDALKQPHNEYGIPDIVYHYKAVPIEQQLEACRDVLKKVTDECLWRSDSEFPLSIEKSQELWVMAVETLEATKPQS